MTYADYLSRLLSPLGVYALAEDTISGALVQALGAELDKIWVEMQQTLADAFPQTAAAAMLPIWEQLLPSAGTENADRPAALRAVAENAGAECTPAHLNELMRAAGLSAAISFTQGAVSITGKDAQRAAVFLAPFLPAHIQYPPEADE